MLVPSCNSSAQISYKLGELGDQIETTTILEAIERVLSHASVRFVAPIMRWMHATIVNGNVSAAGAQESVILELHDVRVTRWLQ